MAIIHELSPHLADLIAAGEVVERPASVAKELIENAIDAGSTRITVEIESGGITYLRIADNGCGMTRSQLKEVRRQIETGAVRCETEPGKRRRKGIGIGLYSVKERIAIYTGYQNSVRVLSKQGAGTIVIITVPKISVKDKNNQ